MSIGGRKLLMAGWLVLMTGWPGGNASGMEYDAKVRYKISAILQPAGKTVEGDLTLIWSNYAPDPVTALPFHLYLNAFSSYESTFHRGRGVGTRGSVYTEENAGRCEIKQMNVEGMGDLTARMRFIQPDDGNREDKSVVEFPLPRPVLPGERLVIHLKFISKLPHAYSRTGWHRNFFMVSQWFPKIGVLEPPGWRHAPATRWNCHQYHANSEFYANFGEFEVELSVPAEYTVGATGEQTGKTAGSREGYMTYRYRQAGVHDFAWTACPDFQVTEQMFSGSRDVSPAEYAEWAEILGRPAASLKLPDVKMIVLMHKEHAALGAAHLETLINAIKYYGLMFGPYPYRTITLVDPAPGASETAGMEYPTFFTAGTHAILDYWPFSLLPVLTVVTHEYGHNYWYGLVASNEFEEPWIDEGINSFSDNTVSFLERQAKAGREPVPVEDSYLLFRMSALSLHVPKDPLDSNSWSYYPGTYSAQAYTRSTLMLVTLQGVMGRKAFFRTLRSFFEIWSFRHPDTRDFLDHFGTAGGPAVRKYLATAMAAGAWLDFSVDKVSNSNKDKKTGIVSSRALLVRGGTIEVPVRVVFRFADGKEIWKEWEGGEAWKEFRFEEKSALRSVYADPAGSLLIDRNLANNSWTSQPRTDGPARAGSLFRACWQHLLQLLALLA